VTCEPVEGNVFCAAHHGLVYDLCWDPTGQLLVSCASDYTAKAWFLSAARSSGGSPAAHGAAAMARCTVLHHPSFVYGCQFHPAPLSSHAASTSHGGDEEALALLAATCTADGDMYGWVITGDARADGSIPLFMVPTGRASINSLLWDPASALHSPDGAAAAASTLYLGSDDGHVSEWLVALTPEAVRQVGYRAVARRQLGVGASVVSMCSSHSDLVAITRADRCGLLRRVLPVATGAHSQRVKRCSCRLWLAARSTLRTRMLPTQ
jgi:WD40 repeat protein